MVMRERKTDKVSEKVRKRLTATIIRHTQMDRKSLYSLSLSSSLELVYFLFFYLLVIFHLLATFQNELMLGLFAHTLRMFDSFKLTLNTVQPTTSKIRQINPNPDQTAQPMMLSQVLVCMPN